METTSTPAAQRHFLTTGNRRDARWINREEHVLVARPVMSVVLDQSPAHALSEGAGERCLAYARRASDDNSAHAVVTALGQ